MRRLLPILLAVVVAVGGLAWLAAPRLIDRFAPKWSVTAAMPVNVSDNELRAVEDCMDVLASTRIVSDARSGRVVVEFHAFEWEMRPVAQCLRDLRGVKGVAGQVD